MSEMLFVPPEPLRPSAAAEALSWLCEKTSDSMNSERLDWRVRGVQLNPLRSLLDYAATSGNGIDPHLPREYVGALASLGKGPWRHLVETSARFTAELAANKRRALRGAALDPRTPDGDTWVFTIPNRPLEKFTGEHAVDTGFKTPPGSFIPVYVIKGRAALEHVLTGRVADRGPTPYHYLAQALGSSKIEPGPGRCPGGLFSGPIKDNETWKSDRKIGSKMFALKMIDGFGPSIDRALDDIVEDVARHVREQPDEIVDLNVMMSRIAYRMIIQASLGDANIPELDDIGLGLAKPVRGLLEYVSSRTMGHAADRKGFCADIAETKRLVGRIGEIVRERHAAGRLHASSPVIDLILGRDGERFDDERLFVFLLPIIFGGHETTGHTLAWALYEMERNPFLKETLLRELDAFRGDHGAAPITTAHYDERPVTQAFLYEIGRRHPPVIALPRTATDAGECPPDLQTGIGAFGFPEHTLFMCNIVGAHMDPSAFPNPREFRVERFMHGVEDPMPRDERGRRVHENMREMEKSFRLLTFGTGAAKCLGQEFNKFEFFRVLDKLLARFEFELVDPHREVLDSDLAISSPEPGALGARIRLRR